MAFKFEIGDPKSKKTFHLEAEAESLIGKIIGEKVSGNEISPKLDGTELEITGTSDKAGFPGLKNKEGPNLRKVLLTKGKGMRRKEKGLRLRKTVRGNTISVDTVQINMKVLKGEVSHVLAKEKVVEEKKAE